MIALIGAPGSGKTTACLTFPNRIWLDFDHKIPAGEVTIPFYDPKFCDSLATKYSPNCPPNQRDALKVWLRQHSSKLTKSQTLILDSWTNIQAAHDMQARIEGEMMSAKERKWAFYGGKKEFSADIMAALKATICRVIVIFHEVPERNEEGELTTKIKVLMDGSYKDELLKDFTDYWRQLCFPYEKDARGNYVLDKGKKIFNPGYFWQLVSDDNFNANMNNNLSPRVRKMKLSKVKADWAEIEKIYATEL